MTVTLDWDNLGFEYHKLPFRYVSHYKNGSWDEGSLSEDSVLHISESSPALHYGQQAFEGLKAYRTKDGSIQLFRPDRNAERLQDTADRLLMPRVSTEQFVDAVKQVVKANQDYVPPYGTGATLYLRPLLIGVGDIIGVKPADEYIFTIFAMPVGSYFKGGLTPTNFIVSEDFDRAPLMVQEQEKLVETMLALYYQGNKLKVRVTQMLFIWIQQLILKLRRLVPQISLELRQTMNLSLHSVHQFYHQLLSIHF